MAKSKHSNRRMGMKTLQDLKITPVKYVQMSKNFENFLNINIVSKTRTSSVFSPMDEHEYEFQIQINSN